MKVSPNLRGPSRKAKYSLATDSVTVARAKDEKNPDKGRIVNLKPHAYKRSEPHAGDGGVTACLLHNDPATCGRGRRLSGSAAEPKRKRVRTGRVGPRLQTRNHVNYAWAG